MGDANQVGNSAATRELAAGGSVRRPRRFERGKSAMVAMVAMLFIAAVGSGAWVATTPELLKRIWWGSAHIAPIRVEGRTGRIIVDLSDPCREMAFDNDTGEISYTTKRCSASVAGGTAPQTQAAGRRFEAISKAFSR
jgi:hypothetical protein